MHSQFKKALILAPHPDDGEFGCGGTINKLLEQGCEVYYATFSDCQKSVPPGFPPDVLVTEVRNATRQLGILPENVFLYNYDVRTFSFHRQEILDDLLKLKKQIGPDLVMMPCLTDVHQDHATIAAEGVRAFKFNTILSYELPWNNFTFNTSCFFKLSEENVLAKISAIREYRSQEHRSYSANEFVRSLAVTRGIQANTKFAEAFEAVRIVY